MIIELVPFLPIDPMQFTVPVNPLASVEGDVLHYNGQRIDFSPIPVGASLPGSAIPVSALLGVHRSTEGKLTVRIRFEIPNGASEHMRFPAPLEVEDAEVVWPLEPVVPQPLLHSLGVPDDLAS